MCNAGDCRWEATFRLAQKKGPGKPPSSSVKGSEEWRFSGGPKAAAAGKAKGGGEQNWGLLREAERVEKVMQLILWGPN